MKFLVGHSGILVALFTCDDCIETFILMSWLILSFNTVLASPIRTGYEGIRAGVSCYHFDARPLVACCAFYLDLLHQLFQGEVYLQLCGTPYGLFTKGAMAGSWVLSHPANTCFAECVPAVRKNNWLQHQCITKRQRTWISTALSFCKRIKGIHMSQSEDAKKKRKHRNMGKCDQLVNRFSFE